jgi:hypothetical protein
MRDKVGLCKFHYRLPDWPSHLFMDAFLERFLYTDDLWRVSHQQYLNGYQARHLICEAPVGFLVQKLEGYLAINNQKPVGVIPGKWPSLAWIIDMVRIADPAVIFSQ